MLNCGEERSNPTVLNLFDIILVIPLVYGLIRGLYKGLIAELSSMVSLIAGVFLSFYFSGDLYDYLAPQVEEPGIGLRVLCYVIVFGVVVAIMYFISRALTKAFMALGIVNHILGGAFGLLKFVFIMIISVHFLAPIQKSQRMVQQETINSSKLYTFFLSYSDVVGEYRKDYFQGDEIDINRGESDEEEQP
jgi:membrane protein required for colicin V production